jgi:hypothetical protein
MREDIIGCDGCDGENYKSEQRKKEIKKETEKFGFMMGFACQNQMFFFFLCSFIFYFVLNKGSLLNKQAPKHIYRKQKQVHKRRGGKTKPSKTNKI